MLAALPAALRTLPALVAVLFVVLLSSVARLLPGLDAYDEHRIASVVLLVAVNVGAALHAVRRGEVPALPRAVWSVLALAGALGLLSALRAPMPRYGLLEFADTVLLVGASLEVARQVARAPARAVRVASAGGLVIVALMEALVAVSYGMHLAGFGTPLFPLSGYVFSHVRHFNQVQLWTLPLLALPVLGLRMRAGRFGAGAVLALWWTLLLASGGRGATLGLAVGLGGAAMLLGRAAWPFLRVQVGALVVGGVLFWALFSGGQGSLVDRRAEGDSGRLQLRQDAGAMIAAHPVLGVGPMHYAYDPPPQRSAHPHNEPLRVLAEWGLPAGLLLLGVAGAGLWTWSRAQRRRRSDARNPWPPGTASALTAALWGAAALSLVDGVFVMPVSQELGVLVVGLALGLYRADTPGDGAVPPGRARLWAAVLGLAALSTAVCVFPDVLDLPARQEQLGARLAERHGQTSARYPRFWQFGYLVP